MRFAPKGGIAAHSIVNSPTSRRAKQSSRVGADRWLPIGERRDLPIGIRSGSGERRASRTLSEPSG